MVLESGICMKGCTTLVTYKSASLCMQGLMTAHIGPTVGRVVTVLALVDLRDCMELVHVFHQLIVMSKALVTLITFKSFIGIIFYNMASGFNMVVISISSLKTLLTHQACVGFFSCEIIKHFVFTTGRSTEVKIFQIDFANVCRRVNTTGKKIS